jgi:N utilization substance protein A
MGFLDGFALSRADAEGMIMAARVELGWIEPPAEAEAEAETEAHPT